MIVECPECGYKIKSGERGRPNKYGITRCTRCGKRIVIDPEKASEYYKIKYEKYKEKAKEYYKKYYLKKKEQIIEKNSKKARITHNLLRKQRMIVLGNKCNICGYNECLEILEFHHINQEHKYNSNDWKTKRFDPAEFLLVCPNCHKKIHLGIINVEKNNRRPSLVCENIF